MKLRSSEIFDNFAKIAQDNGLISKEAAEETNPRYDSKTLSDIEILYGIKPNGKSEKDIIDQAHPESVIIAPAYDRLNGLVENVKERHNIMVGIANKPPQAKLIGRKYAEEELLNELVRLGTLLDSKNQEDLMKLADGCAEKLTKNASIRDWAGALVPIAPLAAASGPVGWIGWGTAAGLIAAYLGATYLINNFGPQVDQGVYGNCERAKDELREIYREQQFSQESRDDLKPYIEKVVSLVSKVQLANKAIRDAKGQEAASEQVMNKLVENYKKTCFDLIAEIPKCTRMLQARIDDGGSETHTDIGAIGKKIFQVFSPDEIVDAVKALITLKQSLEKSLLALETHIDHGEEKAAQHVDSNPGLVSTIQKQINKINGNDTQKSPKEEPGEPNMVNYFKSLLGK